MIKISIFLTTNQLIFGDPSKKHTPWTLKIADTERILKIGDPLTTNPKTFPIKAEINAILKVLAPH